MQIDNLMSQLAEFIISGKKDQAVETTKELLELNVSAEDILDNGLLSGMNVVGKRFRENIYFVPQVLISARAMKSSLAILEPLLSEKKSNGLGTIVIGTVKGDIHDIGKNIVAMMLKSNGFKVIDLGTGISVEQFIEAIKKENADILGMSALLTTTMIYMQTVIDKIKKEDLNVKILVGGAPLSKLFAEQIGADAFAKNASDAVMEAKNLIEISR